MKKIKAGKKGIFFTLDAIIASFIIIGIILLTLNMYENKQQIYDLNFYSYDSINVLSELKISELDDGHVQDMIQQGVITRPNASVMETIGIFWSQNDTDNAEYIADRVLGGLIPSQYNSVLLADNNEIVSAGTMTQQDAAYLTGYKQFVSGIEGGRPVEGYATRIYLSGTDSRMTSSFVYFGGFEGQGNITKKLMLGEFSSIEGIYLEAAPGGDFDLYINGNNAGSFSKGSGGGGTLMPDRWNIGAAAYGYLQEGENMVELVFTEPNSTLTTGFVGGGFLKVDYMTDRIEDVGVDYIGQYAIKKYWIPGIEGLVNIYSSFEVPGELNSMEVYLKYNSSYDMVMNIQGEEIYNGSGQEGVQDVWINDSQLSAVLQYGDISSGTAVYRIFSAGGEVTEGGNADVVIITDASGSMKKAILNDDQGNLGGSCENAYIDPYIRRTYLAQCLDKEMIDTLMNYSGNRIWLVELYNIDDVSWWTDDTAEGLKDIVDKDFKQNGKGKTCLSCAVNQAYDILDEFSDDTRTKSVLFMTDGIATHLSLGNTTEADTQICQGFCDVTGACKNADNEGCSDDLCEGAQNDTYYALSRLYSELDTSIYTVGFGPISQCPNGNESLRRMSEENGGMYFGSNNVTLLREIYQNISQMILSNVEMQNQTIVSAGGSSVLYDDSYIEINYTPSRANLGYGSIPIMQQSPVFGNSLTEGTIEFSEPERVIEMKVTSYSDNLWTKRVMFDNGQDIYDVFDLDSIGQNYTMLGDPFVVSIPVDYLSEQNKVTVNLGGQNGTETGGSPYDRFIYKIAVPGSVGLGEVFESAGGCFWHVEFEDGTDAELNIPSDYAGTETCDYESATYDKDDAVDDAAYRFFSIIDFDGDGLLDVKIDENNLQVETESSANIPFMWGPSFIEARVWK